MTEKRSSTNSYSHILKYTGLFGFVQMLNIVVGIVRNKCVAVILGPEGMGLITLLSTSMNFVAQATGLGIPFSSIKRISELFDSGDATALNRHVSTVRSWSLLAAVIGLLACVALGPLLNRLSFSCGDHTLHFILLAPAVAMTAIAGGELSILKGTRRMKELALVQIATTLLSLLVSVPLYYVFNVKAIVPVISLMAMVNLLPALVVSLRHYPYSLRHFSSAFGEGRQMVGMGVAFTIAAAFTSGGEMAARSLLSQFSDLHTVGLFNAACMITFTYSALAFSAMESDYFPRLSAASHDDVQMLTIVNRQVEVSLMIISPMTCLLVILLPVAMPLLFSQQFVPVVTMAQTTTLALLFKAVSLPLAYINLAKGNSRLYLAFEAAYALAYVVAICHAFLFGGLTAVGWAIVAVHALEAAALYIYANRRFHFVLSRGSVVLLAIIIPCLAVAYFVATSPVG